MRRQTTIRNAQVIGMSILIGSITNLVLSTDSSAQVCNVFGCSAPGAGPCTVFGCPAPPPQPAPTVPNIIVVPGNSTNSTSTSSSSSQNPEQVAACIRELHNFYYHSTQASNSQATALAQSACQSGASAACIQETYTYYYRETPSSHAESAQLAQESCAP